jgi:hypothetical protein
MANINDLLASYPRHRPALSPSHERIYRHEYKTALDGKTIFAALSRRTEGWMHRRVAGGKGLGATLELGAGSLNHLPYESDGRDLANYDIVEPQDFLYENHANLSSIRAVYSDVDDVPTANQYRRIISVAVLEHLQKLPMAVASCALRLEKDGTFQHGIPSEGGALWGVAWRLTTGLSYRLRTGLSYGVVMRHEHINTAPEIVAIVRHFFNVVNITRFPTPFFHESLFTHIHASNPKIGECETYLEHRKAQSSRRDAS